MKDGQSKVICTKCGREVKLIYGLMKDMNKYNNDPGVELMGCEIPSTNIFDQFKKKFKCKKCNDE